MTLEIRFLRKCAGSVAGVSLPQSSLRDASSLSEGAEIGSCENVKQDEEGQDVRETGKVLIPNGNAKLEHFVFMSLLYHDIRILSMRNLLNRPKNLVNPKVKGELYTF